MSLFGKAGALLFGLLLVLSTSDAATQVRQGRDRDLQSTVQGQVTELRLINANTDEVITTLEDGMVIALNAIEMDATTVALNVEAIVNGSDIRSVRFGLNNRVNFNTETSAPYALCENAGSDYYSCASRVLRANNNARPYTITATPRNKNGRSGRPYNLTFTIVEEDLVEPTIVDVQVVSSSSSPSTIDISSGQDVTITVRITAKDDASGVAGGVLILGDTPVTLSSYGFTFGTEPTYQATIDAVNNDVVTFDVDVRIRNFMPSGPIALNVQLLDNVENTLDADAALLAESGILNALTIVNTGVVDTTPPVLVSLQALLPLFVPRNSVVSFEVVVTDAVSGIDWGTLGGRHVTDKTRFGRTIIDFGKPMGDEFVGRVFNNGPELAAGVPHTFVVDLDISPNAVLGEYQLEFSVSDGVKLFTTFNATQLASLGFPSTFTVV